MVLNVDKSNLAVCRIQGTTKSILRYSLDYSLKRFG